MRIARKPTPQAASDSLAFRKSAAGPLRRRRAAVACALGATASLGTVALYQLGLISHLPDPPLPGVDSDRVDASPEAYASLRAPDSLLGVANAAATVALLGIGGPGRRGPVLAVLTTGKAGADALAALYLFGEQLVKHRKVCAWCTAAAIAHVASVVLTLPEARDVVRAAAR